MSEAKRETMSGEGAGKEGSGKAESRPLHPLIELTRNRITEFMREKEAVFWVFVFPVLMAFALGIAFRNTAPQKIPVAVENNGPVESVAQTDSSSRATELYNALAGSSAVTPVMLSADEAARALRSGKVALVVRPVGPVSAGQDTAHSFDYRYDPTRAESRTARLTVDNELQRAMGRRDVAAASDEHVTEPGARYIDFLVPGLIGMNMMGSGIWGIGFAVVSARNRKLLKRFAATPMRRSHYLFSFMLSRLIFLALEVIAIMGFAWLAFGVQVHGSVLSAMLVSLVGGLAFSGLGALLAARPETIEGISGLANVTMLPMWLLSGTFFSSERFPQFLQPFIRALPLTAVNSALRAIVNEGASLTTTWPQLVVILAWGVLSFIIALRIFKWK